MSELAKTIFICGWNERGVRLIRQLHATVLGAPPPIVVVADSPPALPAEPMFEKVRWVEGDPTSDEVLLSTGIESAGSAIILATIGDPKQSDAQSLLIALAIEALCPRIHTAVEVLDSSNLAHFARTSVDETVSLDNISEKLLAQAALNPHITDFYQELLAFQDDGNEIYRVSAPEATIGQTFEAVHGLLDARREILIGLHRCDRAMLNPPPTTRLVAGDELWVIAFTKPVL